ncbi:hypothetical protein [Streptomyces sp. NPDC050535]|uniref:hypothetical protein n=1 Tax=Streptomyces sp. NPDC050535 TaxID=3365626 RepID=UPI003789EBA5
MPYHALEITLIRPLTPAELHQAARTMPLAANHDATRLMTVVHAKTERKALSRLRHQADALLPLDIITTHYPDADGQILLSVTLPPAAHTALRTVASHTGQPPHRFLQQTIHRALDRHASNEADRLDQVVTCLLASTTAPHLLAALGRALTRTLGAHSAECHR